MDRTAGRIAMTAATTAVTLSMAAPAAMAHERDGSHDGDRDGYSAGYDGDHDRYDGDRYSGDRDRYGGDHHDGYDGDRVGDESSHGLDGGWYKTHDGDEADGDHAFRHTRVDRHRAWDKTGTPGREVALAHQKQQILAQLSRADEFLAELGDRISRADLDPGLKSTLLGLIAQRRAAIADRIAQVQAASSWQDLRAVRHAAFTSPSQPTT